MAKAIWNGAVLAESDKTILFDRNRYFPMSSIDKRYFRESETHTTCFWKGVASYYSIEVDGKTNVDAAWYYPEPSAQAQQIRGYVAFWKGVEVVGP
jgi:uncharacterized protein (DUF427 family)